MYHLFFLSLLRVFSTACTLQSPQNTSKISRTKPANGRPCFSVKRLWGGVGVLLGKPLTFGDPLKWDYFTTALGAAAGSCSQSWLSLSARLWHGEDRAVCVSGSMLAWVRMSQRRLRSPEPEPGPLTLARTQRWECVVVVGPGGHKGGRRKASLECSLGEEAAASGPSPEMEIG